MTDIREQAIVRLLEIVQSITGVTHVERNNVEVDEDKLSSIIIQDGDEDPAEPVAQSHSGHAPQLITMMPQVFLTVEALPKSVGSDLNALRIKLLKAVLTDSQLKTILTQNGKVRYGGCRSAFKGGRRVTGQMLIPFEMTYPLIPQKL